MFAFPPASLPCLGRLNIFDPQSFSSPCHNYDGALGDEKGVKYWAASMRELSSNSRENFFNPFSAHSSIYPQPLLFVRQTQNLSYNYDRCFLTNIYSLTALFPLPWRRIPLYLRQSTPLQELHSQRYMRLRQGIFNALSMRRQKHSRLGLRRHRLSAPVYLTRQSQFFGIGTMESPVLRVSIPESHFLRQALSM